MVVREIETSVAVEFMATVETEGFVSDVVC
jgi:hypothetical protein